MEHVPSVAQLADLLTKNLPRVVHNRLCARLFVEYSSGAPPCGLNSTHGGLHCLRTFHVLLWCVDATSCVGTVCDPIVVGVAPLVAVELFVHVCGWLHSKSVCSSTTGCVGMDMVPTTSTSNQRTRRLVVAVVGVAVIVLFRNHRRVTCL